MSSDSLADSMIMDIPMISNTQDMSESIDEDCLDILLDLDTPNCNTAVDLKNLGLSFSSIVEDEDEFLNSIMTNEVLSKDHDLPEMTRPITPEQSPRSSSPAPSDDSDEAKELMDGLKRLFKTMLETDDSRRSVKRQRCSTEKSTENFFLSPSIRKIEASRRKLITAFVGADVGLQ